SCSGKSENARTYQQGRYESGSRLQGLRMKILVAEDDFPSRELLTEILTAWGYEVLQAANGFEALGQLAHGLPDLGLLDIQMPLLDGFGVIRQIRCDERYRSLRVIALTAYAMREDRERATRAGFDAYLSKPVEIEALRALIASRLLPAPLLANPPCQ